MGEYAKRLSDGADVKIGTCEDMYYLRFDDRHKIIWKPGNVDPTTVEGCNGLRFRLPFPDEDGMDAGEIKDHEYNRGLRLYRLLDCEWCHGTGIGWDKKTCARCHGSRHYGHEDFPVPEDADAGRIQIHHEHSGLLISLPCYHGAKLPDVPEDWTAHWNGKSPARVLSSLLCIVKDGEPLLYPVVRCQFCSGAWREPWDRVWEYIEKPMQDRLAKYRHTLPTNPLEPVAA